MCLACYINVKTKENVELSKTLNHVGAPWMISVKSPEDFKNAYEPNPDLIEKFGRFGVINHVFFHNPSNNKTIKLSLENCEFISENSLALIFTGVDNSIDIWAIQWKDNVIPNFSNIGVKRPDFNFRLT